MELKGKKLVFFGGSGLDACAIRRAKELGITTIVCNKYSADRSPAKTISDEAWSEDFSDIERMVNLIQERGADGIFVGWTDSHLPYYAAICEKAGLPCCGTPEQFNVLSNDKSKFKALCRQYGVPVVADYPLDEGLAEEDLRRIRFPVMLKPVDGSGGRGVKRCDDERELREHYAQLRRQGSKVICERYIDTKKEIFLNYTISNGTFRLAATYMCYESRRADGSAGPAVLHVYPSSYTRQYQLTVEPAVIRMLKGIGLRNAILSLQGFVTDSGFVFHETGLRMGGGQSYVFTRALNGVSALDQMLEFSVTGKITERGAERDDPYFAKPCVNYYIPLESGTIASIEGFQEIERMPQV